MLHYMSHDSKSMKLVLAGFSFLTLVSGVVISAEANSEAAGNASSIEALITSQHYTETDISEDAALLSIHWDAMEYASTLQAKLRLEYPEEFLGLYMHDNRVQSVILWSRDGQIPESLSNDPRILVERGDYSEKELSAIQLSVAKDLSSQGLDVSSYTDFMRQRVALHVPDTKYEAILQFMEAQKRSHQTASAESDEFDYSEVLVVERIDAEPTTTAEVFAGVSLKLSSGTHECTSGFVVHDGSGIKKLTTAGHCKDALKFGNISLSYSHGSFSGSHDVQYHTVGSAHSLVPKSYGAPLYQPSPWVVKGSISRNSLVSNSTVCKYGQITGYACGVLTTKDYMPTGGEYTIGNFNNTFLAVKSPNSSEFVKKGDSGGPWFAANKAVGITSGSAGSSSSGFFGVGMSVSYFSPYVVSVG